MDIKQAKEEIRRTVLAYTERDALGALRIPMVRQRPLLLMGPPGVGKTAIFYQLAQELGVNLVSYTMTHHTRQSALGLPVLREKTFGGKAYTATEYTMSEILASVYERIEKTGLPTGILFLDEINCVSETLMPAMLQLLQSKQFGTHRLPEGWVIAAAGNPPAYNESARTFDTVTMDRVRLLQIEADYHVWRDYAHEKGLHPAVLSYLELNPEHFFCVERHAHGRSFVTARGWEDLSQLLASYERLGFEIHHRFYCDGQTLRRYVFRRSQYHRPAIVPFRKYPWSGQLPCAKKTPSGFALVGNLCLHPALQCHILPDVPECPRLPESADHIPHFSRHMLPHQCTLHNHRQDNQSYNNGFYI